MVSAKVISPVARFLHFTALMLFCASGGTASGIESPVSSADESSALLSHTTIASQDGGGEPAVAKSDGAGGAAKNSLAPKFEFRTPYIGEWLLLGPIYADQIPDDPTSLFDDIAEGKTVQFPGDVSRTWKSFSALERGTVPLVEFCKQEGLEAAGATVYAYTGLVADRRDVRSIRVGADDESRIWVDHGNAKSLHSDSTQFQVDFSKQSHKGLLVEATNKTGDFNFLAESGMTWQGQVTFRDGVTPNPNVAVGLYAAGTTERLLSAVSDASGKLSLRPVPYSIDVELRVGGETTQPVWFVEEETQGRSFRVEAAGAPKIVVSDLMNEVTAEAQPIQAIQYDESKGYVYFVREDRYNEIQVLAGKNVFTHPYMKDMPPIAIADFQITDDGTIYLETATHGVLSITESRRVQFFGEAELEGFERVDAPEGFRFARDDLLGINGARAWVTLTGTDSDDQQSGDSGSSGTARAMVLWLSGEEGSYEEYFRHDHVMECLSIDSHGIVFTDHARLYHRTHAQDELAVEELPFDQIRDCKRDAEGQIWLLAEDGLATVEDAGGLQVVSYLDDGVADGEMRMWFGQRAWITGRSGIFLVQDGLVNRVAESKYTTGVPWGLNGVLLGTASGKIYGVSHASSRSYGARDGVKSSRFWKVAASEHGTILSGKDMHLQRSNANGPWRELPRYRTITGFPVGESKAIAILGPLGTCDPNEYHVPPKLIEYNGQETRLLSVPTSQTSLVYSDVLQLRSGRVLLGTKTGLFEYFEGEVTLSAFQDRSEPFSVYSLAELSNGELWMGTPFGRFCRLDGEKPAWQEMPNEGASVYLPQCFASLENGSSSESSRMLIGTNSGLFVFDQATGELQKVDAPFSSDAFIQDMSPTPGGGPILIAVRGLGVYSFHQGQWSRIKLGGAADLTDVWDIEHEASDKVWFTTSDRFIAYHPAVRKPVVFVDSVQFNEQWQPFDSSEPLHIRTAQDALVRTRLSTSFPASHVGYRYRTNQAEPWRTLWEDAGELEVAFKRPGNYRLEVQAFDRDHNHSEIVRLPVEVYLPLWRWRSLWWTAGALSLSMCLGLVFFIVELGRARRATLEADRAARAAAEVSAREQEGLLLRVCHDLKNPFNVVFWCAEMLGKGELTVEEACPLLNGSVESMRYLSHQLLSFARLNRERECQFVPIFVRSFVTDLSRETMLGTDGAERRFGSEIAPDVPRWLNSDPFALKEILVNLIENAKKHCPQDAVSLRVEMIDEQPVFAVEDAGPGVPENELERVFEAFYQTGDPSRKRLGVGLGLSICKTLTERLGGTIAASNRLTGGARFAVTLPKESVVSDAKDSSQWRRYDSEDSGDGQAADVQPPHFALHEFRGKTLVVDDLPFVGNTLVKLLEQAGIAAVYAGPFDAIELSQHEKFVEALIDLNMQGKDGFQVADELSQLHGDALRIRAMSESEASLEAARQSATFDTVIPKSQIFDRGEPASQASLGSREGPQAHSHQS